MKTLNLNSLVAVIIALILASSAQATFYNNPGSGQPYNLYSGDTLNIYQGIYHGDINTFNSGAVIIIVNGAKFSPTTFNSPAGKILNYGQISMSSLSFQSGASLVNYGQVTVSNSLEFYNGSTSTLVNYLGAILNVGGSFNFSTLQFTNDATLYITGDMNMYNTASTVTNNGKILMNGNFNINGGILANNNIIRMNDLNVYGGSISNAGQMNPRGNASYSGSGTYSNACMMNTGKGLTLYSAFNNNGLLWVGATNSDVDQFYVNSTFTGSANSFVRAYKMINYSTITGANKFYIYGDSYTSGTVGTAGSSVTDSIKVYDATRTGSNIFDTQYGTIYNNVKFSNLTLPDTSNITYSGCSAIYRNASSSTALPVKFTSFTTKLVNDAAQLNWTAAYEENMRFDVERSTDNRNFKSIAVVNANAIASYVATDKEIAQLSGVVYYRIKGTAVDGDVKYTEVRMVRLNTISGDLNVYPNPVAATSQLQFSATQSGQAVVKISNAAGQQISAQAAAINAGRNTITLKGIDQLKAGIYLVELVQLNETIGTVKVVRN